MAGFKLSQTNPYITHANLNAMHFNDYGFAAIQRLFQKMGADNNIELRHHKKPRRKTGPISVVKTFYYPGSKQNEKGEWVECMLPAQQHYTLDEYCIPVARLNTRKEHRLSKIQSAHDKTLNIMMELKEELKKG